MDIAAYKRGESSMRRYRGGVEHIQGCAVTFFRNSHPNEYQQKAYKRNTQGSRGRAARGLCPKSLRRSRRRAPRTFSYLWCQYSGENGKEAGVCGMSKMWNHRVDSK